MKITTIILAVLFVGCVTQPRVPVKKQPYRNVRNFSLESGYCPNNHNMINLPLKNGYALDPVLNPEAYHKTNIENLK